MSTYREMSLEQKDEEINELKNKIHVYDREQNMINKVFGFGALALCIGFGLFLTYCYFENRAAEVDLAAVCDTMCEAVDMEVAHCRDFRVTCVGGGNVRTLAH